VRVREGRLVAGVFAGLGRRFGVSPWILRAAFVVSMIVPGPQFLLYIALWVLMPHESRPV
jgi:phage shock protein PspC (stress-responsive transcriptional regulator)